MSQEPEYDEATCITAGELRAMGMNLPAHIPDCAWVPRNSILIRTGDAGAFADGRITLNLIYEFTKPFQWISMTVEIKDPSNSNTA